MDDVSRVGVDMLQFPPYQADENIDDFVVDALFVRQVGEEHGLGTYLSLAFDKMKEKGFFLSGQVHNHTVHRDGACSILDNRYRAGHVEY